MFRNVGEESECDVIAARDVDERCANDAAQIKLLVDGQRHGCAGVSDLEALPAVQATGAEGSPAGDRPEAWLREKAFGVGPDGHYKSMRVAVQRVVLVVPVTRVVGFWFCPTNNGSFQKTINIVRPQADWRYCV